MVFQNQVDELLEKLYIRSCDKENRRVLKDIVHDAHRERGAYVNADFADPLDFILTNSVVYDFKRLKRLEEKIERLVEKIKELEVYVQ